MTQFDQLFKGIGPKEKEDFLKMESSVIEVPEGEYIFYQEDPPQHLYVLLEGSILIENIDSHGQRSLVNIFTQSGTIFGEVYLFLEKKAYDYSCRAHTDAKILCIPKRNLLRANPSHVQIKLMQNLLGILSQKAHFLNQKLLIVNSLSLRQKIIKFILASSEGNRLKLVFNREELANYLGVTRPSLSRELMRMQEDGLIHVDKHRVSFDRNRLKQEIP